MLTLLVRTFRLRKNNMKINLGKLVNDNYKQNEIITILAEGLTEVTKGLASSIASQNWGTVGATSTQLANLAVIAKSLDETVNGQKEKTVL